MQGNQYIPGNNVVYRSCTSYAMYRHGNEENLVTLMGVMQALTSFVEDDDDQLRQGNFVQEVG